MAFADQQRFDGYAQIVDHADRRKGAFDKRVLAHPPREVTFKAGDLVQVYRSDLDYTFKTERKLLPKFSVPRRVISRDHHSYKLETLEGIPIGGRFSSRRLRLFIPRKGTELELAQAAIEKEWRRREEVEDEVKVDGVVDKAQELDVDGPVLVDLSSDIPRVSVDVSLEGGAKGKSRATTVRTVHYRAITVQGLPCRCRAIP